MHLTETCEKDSPHLITHVATTPATRADEAMVEPIHADLERDQLLPTQHFLDPGYITAQTLVTSQKDYGVEVIGPPELITSGKPACSKGLMPAIL